MKRNITTLLLRVSELRKKKVIAVFISVLVFSSALFILCSEVKADWDDWMQEGYRFEFITIINYTQPEERTEIFNYSATVSEVGSSNITFIENYSCINQTDDEYYNEFTSIFNKATRENRNFINITYYSWLWVGLFDIGTGWAYLADKIYTLEDTTGDNYIFGYSSITGEAHTMYFAKTDNVLWKAEFHLINNNTEANATTTRTYFGTSSGKSSEETKKSALDKLSQEYGFDNDYHPLGGKGTQFFPPYKTGEARAYGWSQGFANHYAGSKVGWGDPAFLWEHSGVSSGAGYGRGFTICSPVMHGPGPEQFPFTVSQTGYYDVNFHHEYSGHAYIYTHPPVIYGFSFALERIRITGRIYEYETNYLVGSKTDTIVDKTSPPWPVFLDLWNDRYHNLGFEVYLKNDRYYWFYTDMYAEHIAATIGWAWAGTNSEFTDIIIMVEVIKQ